MQRAKKIAIVTTILAAGTAVAFCFRKPEMTAPSGGSHVGMAEKGSEAIELSRWPVNSTASRGTDSLSNSTAAQPKLTGYIEPVTQPLMPVGPTAAEESRFERVLRETSTPAAASRSAPGASGMQTIVKTEAQTRPGGAAATASVSTDMNASAESQQEQRKPLGWREPNRTLERSMVEQPPRSDDLGQTFAATAPAVKHKIVDGDTLAALAARYLGNTTRGVDIYDYNRDVLPSPELLPIGKDIRIPPHGYRRANDSNTESDAGARSQPELKLVPIVAAGAIVQTPIQKPIQAPSNLAGAAGISAAGHK